MDILFAEQGQGIVEYAFLLSFIFLVVVGVLYLFGISVYDIYDYAVPILVDTFS
jgi:Flp pilus assembly pilin Flp